MQWPQTGRNRTPFCLLWPLGRLEGHSGKVWSAAFSPDGQRVVTASDDNTARVFKIVTAEDIARLLASNKLSISRVMACGRSDRLS
jgi:WD40 repeat protein